MENIKKLTIVCLYGTNNNTKTVLTDPRGRVLYRDSGGMNCKQGRDKDSLKVASTMATRLNEVLTNLDIKNLVVKVRNRGAGYSTTVTNSVRLILTNLQKYYNVLRVERTTPFIHGTIRPQKPKRR